MVSLEDEYKYPQPNTCDKCNGFDVNCTRYPREDWPMLWLTNQCDKFEAKELVEVAK